MGRLRVLELPIATPETCRSHRHAAQLTLAYRRTRPGSDVRERLLWRLLNEGGVRSSTHLRGEAWAVTQRSLLPPGPLTHQASRELAFELATPTAPSRKLRISVSTVTGKGGRTTAATSSGKLLDDQ